MVSIAGLSACLLPIPGASVCCLFCLQCTTCPFFAAVIMTGVRLFNENGDICSAQGTSISNEATGETFIDNAQTLRALFISTCTLYIPLFCCMKVAFMMTVMAD